MSISSIDIVMSRIRAASIDSPIAVFRLGDGLYDAVFANTIQCRQRIANNPPEFAGVFHCAMDPDQTLRKIRGERPRLVLGANLARGFKFG